MIPQKEKFITPGFSGKHTGDPMRLSGKPPANVWPESQSSTSSTVNELSWLPTPRLPLNDTTVASKNVIGLVNPIF